MERSARVPPEEFAAALGRLDPEEFAAFVGDIWRGTAEEVSVEPPVVTAGSGDDEVRLLAAAGESDDPPDGVDAVVTAEERSLGLPSVGPSELRQRVLYGLPAAEADEVCERYLDLPARSAEYPPDDPPGTDTDGEDDEDRQAGASPAPGPTAAAPGWSRFGRLSDAAGPQVAMVALLAVLVLAASATAVFVGGLVSGDIAGTASGDDPAGAEAASGTPGSGSETVTPSGTEERDWGGWEAIPNGLPNSGETPTQTPPREGTDGPRGAVRYTDLEPTCNRSYLHVVQIQMNALKYNDNATDDGIRTVRRFASPRNREAVGPFERFVDIVKSPPYAPMLSYDSAEYEPRRPSEDTARVRVVTRADGNVTARYVFRLSKQEGGKYDGCWMTEGVQPLTDSNGPVE
jgi:hypothetical protein